MNGQINESVEQLENAFQLFNQFSEKLAGSYEGLENHVALLSKELADERNERLNQLAEKELLARRLETLLDALPAGIVVLDDEGVIIQTNPVSRDMLSLKTCGIERKAWNDIAKRVFVTDGNELRLKDGRWVTVSACTLGTYPGKIILISDVTETHTLQKMLNRQHRLSSLGEMVASLAHQIRTPLASALLYITGLNHPANDARERTDFINKAKERLCHLEHIVDDMLMFAKGEVSDSEYVLAENLFVQLKDFVNPKQQSTLISFFIHKNIKHVAVRANADALLSAFQNIIDNAIDACVCSGSDEPKIEISVLLNDKNQLEINIKDSGSGMTEEVKKRVLEPFFTTKPGGTGLGMSVVNTTIARYGGLLQIVSQQDVGTEFIIRLPRTNVDGILSSNLTSGNTVAGYNKRSMHERLQVNDAREGEL